MLKHIALDLKQVDYQVMTNTGLNNYNAGHIVKAYLIESVDNSDVALVYHPAEGEYCPSIDVCRYYSLGDIYRPIEDEKIKEAWINLPD